MGGDDDEGRAQLRELFQAIDRDNGGFVAEGKLVEAIENAATNYRLRCILHSSKWLRPLIHPGVVKTTLKKLRGKTREGSVSWEEFEAFWTKMRPVTEPPSEKEHEALAKIFDLIDGDGDGTLNRRELLVSLGVGGNSRARAEISKSEWLRPLLKPKTYASALLLMDSDGDGKISLEEFEEFWSLSRSSNAHGIMGDDEKHSGWPIPPWGGSLGPVQVEELANVWGIDIAQEASLLWIVREALEAPMPPEWIMKLPDSEDGICTFEHIINGTVMRSHPAEKYFLDLLEYEREKMAEEKESELGAEDAWMRFLQPGDSQSSYYYNFITCKSSLVAPLSLISAPAQALDGDDAMKLQLSRNVKKTNSPKRGRRTKQCPEDAELLRFKSWWNEGGSRGTTKRYLDLDFHIPTGNLQVSLKNSDRIYTMSHVNLVRGGVAQCWDLHIGAKLDVLGRRTSLMQANDLATSEWLEYQERHLRGVWEELKTENTKYSIKHKGAPLRVPKMVNTGKKGHTNLRIILDDIQVLHRNLAASMPGVADRIVANVAMD